MKNYLVLLTFFLLLSSCQGEKQPITKTTVLEGTVINRDSSKILSLISKGGDYRINPIEIQIVNGRFQYLMKSNYVQEYQMAFNDELENGSWRTVNFYNDADTIRFTLYPRAQFDKNSIDGGDLNKKRANFNSTVKTMFYDKFDAISSTKIDSLNKINQWYSKEMADVYAKLRNEKDRIKQSDLYKKRDELTNQKKDLTPQARVWQDKIDSIFLEYQKWQTDIVRSDNTLFGYSLLMDKLYANSYDKTFDLLTVEKNLKNYQSKFNNHPYTLASKNIINGIKNAKKGGYYIDFSSKTKDDRILDASVVISKNKLTLIDLWAPWCGPCIAKGKALKPAYAELHKKGLGVLAVIGEIDKKEAYVAAAEKYQYPWAVNYEINQEFHIWEKYNITRSGGSQFLVNAKGKILAINPKPTEIDSILNSMKP